MNVRTMLRNIKTLKIQGAEEIAKSSVDIIRIIANNSKAKSVTGFYQELINTKKKILSLRPTEPCTANTINFILYNLNITDIKHLKSHLDLRLHKAIEHFSDVKKKITEYGSNKIKKGMTIFTHCHSSTVVDILIAARKQKKTFFVNNTETRPFLQGRITAKQLSDAGIGVRHWVDSAARLALKKADLVLFGADAITAEGKVINKIGSELIAEVAQRYDIPVFVCTDSWKFDPKTVFGFEEPIERRSQKEVWKNPPKNVTIMNPAFEKISPRLITGIVSELGVYKPEIFIEEVAHNYPWMFK